MLISTLLCFHLCWMLTLGFTFPGSSPAIPLNMVEESVDDMYEGCRDSMKNILNQKFSAENGGIWTMHNDCASQKLQLRSPAELALTKEHMQAICMYTGFYYGQLNTDTREQKNAYGGSFQFHNLHFYLTTALQILNPYKQCHTTYRRTWANFQGQVGQMIRFGSFASSSTMFNLVGFGTETCFKIETCLGADLKKYSLFYNEYEVLIPPYETFTIQEKLPKYKAPYGLRDCKVVYVLKHSGTKSNLNCKLVQTGSKGPISSWLESLFKNG